MTKVTWFSRGSGSSGESQFSTDPSTLRSFVESRELDPDPEEPPVSRTMFSEESGEKKLCSSSDFKKTTLTSLEAGIVFIGEVVLENVPARIHASTLEDRPLNPLDKH